MKLFNFFFYLKKNKTLSMNIKDKCCISPQGLQLHWKWLQHTFLFIFQKFRDCFFIEQLQWQILVSERNFLKKKVNGEIAFTLIILIHAQIQEIASRSTTKRAFFFLAKFIITKYLKEEVNDNLSVCVDECSPCGLSITGDITIYQCHMIKR